MKLYFKDVLGVALQNKIIVIFLMLNLFLFQSLAVLTVLENVFTRNSLEIPRNF